MFIYIVAICVAILVALFLKGGSITSSTTYLGKLWLRRTKQPSISVPKDTVLLHQIPRHGLRTPNKSPFCLKLETWLRWKKIPYVNDFTDSFAQKSGKSPWIEYNGTILSDSNIIMEFLRQERGSSRDTHLSPPEKGIARAFQKMVEEHLYWCMGSALLADQAYFKIAFPFTGMKFFILSKIIKRKLRDQQYAQGIGRHDYDTVDDIGREDLRAISQFLADKPYMMGKEMSDIDCSIFGILCQIIYHLPGSKLHLAIQEDFTNIAALVQRIKEQFWPDWNDIVSKS